MSPRAPGGTGRPGSPGRHPAGVLSRRALLGTALAGLALPALSACRGGPTPRATSSTPPRRPAPALADDGIPLVPTPPLAPSTIDPDGVRVFRLRARAGTTEFRPGVATPTCGYEGAYLGPTLRARRGETVRVEVVNELLQDTTLHWHGMELPGAADGGPHALIPSGGSSWPTWTVAQPAATLWYHPHPHGATTAQVLRGLAGAFLVDDPDGRGSPGLPDEYGVDDVPLLLQDQRLTADGRIDEETRTAIGPLGDVVLVNGVAGGCLPVTTTRVRLRVVNASPARVYALAAADGRDLVLVGTDGGLLAAPVPVRSVRLSPGERAEVVVALTPGERLGLVSLPPDLGLLPQLAGTYGAAGTLPLLELRAAAELRPSPDLPATTAVVPPADAASAGGERRFELSAGRINGRTPDPGRIDLRVPLGATEVWTVTSAHEQPHSFHPHGVRFRVLSVGGAAPPPELAGWKDTVYVPPRTPLRLLVRFDQPADERTPFMYHCHVLWHEDQGMMGQFVVDPET
ncbi:multicopper oxidase family protein [Trujillonella endophytica]|uniref:Multicopper oxidase CueO n=1 Tax=Trujillonella endophytica TaxID=673521 RepID=A0A1H8UU00_9ACTN|nr:multicopper oxidase domain-containing protein [Trujillella endophytica]SEP06048.1 Multicopper oxidase with three cupredoxin domains (includes cell division protein FtsP and spore coat protein CotA) [Trujillella endophytica]